MRKFSQSEDEEEKKDAEYDRPAEIDQLWDFTYNDLLDQLVKFSSDKLTKAIVDNLDIEML